jgi:hypothetical protein
MVLSAAIGLPFIIAIAFLLLSAGRSHREIEERTGTLKVEFGSYFARVESEKSNPGPARYDVMGIGPDGIGFDISTTDTTASVDQLAEGTWTVIVTAENASGVFVGQGEATTRIAPNSVSSIGVVVNPLTGHGGIAVPVSWDTEMTLVPSLDARLVPADGEAISLEYGNAGAGKAMLSAMAVPAGSYVLVVRLSDGDRSISGAVDTVTIREGAVATGKIEFGEDGPSGSVRMNIDPQPGSDEAVSIQGVEPVVRYGSALDVSLSTDGYAPGSAVSWYLNGELLGTGETITVGKELPHGIYRLDCTIINADGKKAESTFVIFEVSGTIAA